MNEHRRALISATVILGMLLSVSLFVTTASVKASQKVKSLIEEEKISLSLPKKSSKVKHKPVVITTETSIKQVHW